MLVNTFIGWTFYYAACFALVVGFRIRRSVDVDVDVGSGAWMAMRGDFVAWSTLVLRLLVTSVFVLTIVQLRGFQDDVQKTLSQLNVLHTLLTSLGIWLSLLTGQPRLIRLLNRFVKLHRHAQQIASDHQQHGQHDQHDQRAGNHIWLLLIKLLCLGYEFYGMIIGGWRRRKILVTLLAGDWLQMGSSMIWHVSFFAYLSVGDLFASVNHTLRHAYAARLSVAHRGAVQSRDPGARLHRRRFAEAIQLFRQCTQLHRDAFHLGLQWQRFIQLPLLYLLAGKFSNFLFLIYFGLRNFQRYGRFRWDLMGRILKPLVDILLLTLSAHWAVKSAEDTRHMAYYVPHVPAVPESLELRREVEDFVMRLRLNSFQLQLLRLFDISNELTLGILSVLISLGVIALQYSTARTTMEAQART